MATAGFLLQLLGLFASFGAIVFYVMAISGKSESNLKIGNGLLLASAGTITLASVILLAALITSDFTIKYVAQYTDLSLPMFYKVSAFWGGQAGSLLLWALLIVVFATIEVFRLKKQSLVYRSSVYLACSVAAVFFIFLICFVQNPFETLDFMPRDGSGLNPMLQNPGMVIHPPTLYIGYVGFTVIVAHGFAALVAKDFSSLWIKLSRSWALIIWVFLTIGIVIGGWWAYVELGWGGYWAWDPVENASLFPWFTATAFMHSAYVYDKKGTMKAWAFALILLTFELTILGTFITRSGVIQSVHSFGKNVIGNFFLIFIVLTTLAYAYYMHKHRKEIEDKGDFKFASREGMLFIGNWVFIGITFVTILGTFLPWITELLGMTPITVGIEYFNRVSIPFFIAILIGSGVAPLIPFGDIKGKDFLKRLIIPVGLAVVTAVIFALLGYTQIIPLVLIACTAFSFVVTVEKTFSRIKKLGVGSLISSNRFFAAMLIHFSLVVMAFGVTMSAFYNVNVDEVVKQNSVVKFYDLERYPADTKSMTEKDIAAMNEQKKRSERMKEYSFEVGQVYTEKGINYISHYVPIKIMKNNEYFSTAYPEMRIYNKHQDSTMAEVAYYSMFQGDLYFIFSGFDIDLDQVRVQAIFQPFIVWIWAGCILMAIGGFYGAVSFRRKKDEPKKK